MIQQDSTVPGAYPFGQAVIVSIVEGIGNKVYTVAPVDLIKGCAMEPAAQEVLDGEVAAQC